MKHLILLLATIGIGSTHAEFFNANRLYELLNGTEAQKSVGTGYILGVHDVTRGTVHCSPSEASSTQVRDMVLSALVAVPEKRHLTADTYVTAVLKQAWPCDKPAKSTSKNV